MRCPVCGAEMVRGRFPRKKRKCIARGSLMVCTACGRAQFLNYNTGRLQVIWTGRVSRCAEV